MIRSRLHGETGGLRNLSLGYCYHCYHKVTLKSSGDTVNWCFSLEFTLHLCSVWQENSTHLLVVERLMGAQQEAGCNPGSLPKTHGSQAFPQHKAFQLEDVTQVSGGPSLQISKEDRGFLPCGDGSAVCPLPSLPPFPDSLDTDPGSWP